MKTQSVLLNRYSCRGFTEEQITESELSILLQAANSAPVSLRKYDNVELCIIQNSQMIDEIEQTTKRFLPCCYCGCWKSQATKKIKRKSILKNR